MAHPSPLTAQFLLVLGILAFGLIPEAALHGRPLAVREALCRDQLNDADYERMERGYYERLLDTGRYLSSLAELGEGRRALARAEALPFDAGPLTITVDDLREYILKPNLSILRRGVPWSTNSLGMRDQEYEIVKPPHTFRIALVGDSIGSGWGVDNEHGFEPLLECSLDAKSRKEGGPAIEILNFAVPGHAPGQRWDHFTKLGWKMGPDLVIYEATLADPGWDERRLRGLLPRGIGWDSPLYRDALALAGATPGGDFETYKRVLRQSRWEILANVYRSIAADCRARSVPSVWVLIPRVGKANDPEARGLILDLARAAGFSAVVDLSDAFDGLDPDELAIDRDDYHPNAEGHERLALRLESLLCERPELRALWTKVNPEALEP
jgi:GDSL-like lipase/acylhydrolase family protein